MNQILNNKNNNISPQYLTKNKKIPKINNNKYEQNNKIKVKAKEITKYKIIILFCFILIIISTFYYLSKKYFYFNNEKISKNIKSNYNVISLYSKNSFEKKEISETKEPFIIGLIQIDKIKLSYPILSTCTNDLLKISPCRFSRTYAKQNAEIYALRATIMLIINFLVIYLI